MDLFDWIESLVAPSLFNLFIFFGKVNIFSGNTTFYVSLLDLAGLTGGHPDLSTKSLCRSLNTSFFRSYADKKLYVRYPSRSILIDEFRSGSDVYPFYYMDISLIRGPNGLDPLITVADFTKYIDKIGKRQIVLGWTTKYPEEETSPMGYTEKNVLDMLDILTINYTFPILELEAVHASYSVDIIRRLFNVTQFILISTLDQTENTANKINILELMLLVTLCGRDRVYLNIPDSARYRIVPPPRPITKNPNRKIYSWNTGTGLFKQEAILMVNICLFHVIILIFT